LSPLKVVFRMQWFIIGLKFITSITKGNLINDDWRGTFDIYVLHNCRYSRLQSGYLLNTLPSLDSEQSYECIDFTMMCFVWVCVLVHTVNRLFVFSRSDSWHIVMMLDTEMCINNVQSIIFSTYINWPIHYGVNGATRIV